MAKVAKHMNLRTLKLGWTNAAFSPNQEVHLLFCVVSWALFITLALEAGLFLLQIVAVFSGFAWLYVLYRFPRLQFTKHLLAGILLGSLSILLNGPPGETVSIRENTYANLEGIVKKIDVRSNNNYRILIHESMFSRKKLDREQTLIRLSVRTKIPKELKAGDKVTVSALLQSPGGMIVPGGYNFARAARFQGIELTGFSVSDIQITPGGIYDGSSLSQTVNNLRHELAARIRNTLPTKEASIVLALTLGIKSDIPDKVAQNMREAGLSHLLAISGLHMGLIALISFFLAETLFAAMPAVALRVMPRKLAVLPVWVICLGYLLLSGASTATLRAFIMISVGLVALLTDRKVFTLRSVLIAAGIILFLSPQSLFSVGFQLSFAATTGLVLFYSRWPNLWQVEEDSSIRKLVRYAAMIGVTSAVAQLSIAPFVLYHFQTISIISLATNIVVLPIVSFLLMPLLLFFIVCTSLGWTGLLAIPVEKIISLILIIAENFAAFPFAVVRLQQMPNLTFALLILACTAILAGQYKARLPFVFALIFGAGVAHIQHRNVDLLISRSGGAISMFSEGKIYSAGGRDYSFRAEAWRQYWGKDISLRDERLSLYKVGQNRRVELVPSTYLSKVTSINAARHACGAGDMVILPRRYARYCNGAKVVITTEELEEKGPLGIKQPLSTYPELIWSNE